MGRKHCGKRRNCSLRAISPFTTVFSKGLFPGGIKSVIVWEWVKEFADNNFKFDENSKKISKHVENTLKTLWEKEKLLVMNNFSFSQSVFKRRVLQTRKNQGLFGKGLNQEAAMLEGVVSRNILEYSLLTLPPRKTVTLHVCTLTLLKTVWEKENCW